MKNKLVQSGYIFAGLICLFFSVTIKAQIETVECYTSSGKAVAPGSVWYENYNGVQYECTCSRQGGADCVPVQSSPSGSTSSSYNYQTEIMQSVVAPLIQNLFDWIFSPSENSSNSEGYDQAERDAENEKYRKANEEYKRKVMEQVTKANDEYTTLLKDKFENQKQLTVNSFKDRIAKSESSKNIKLLNCAAYRSIEISKAVIEGELDFRELTGPLENLRVLGDFENNKNTDCPEVKISVPEVTAVSPISFQEMFFQSVKMKSDSITVKVGIIKEKERKLKEVITEREKMVQQLKKTEKPDNNETNNDNDKLLQEALNALNEALEEEKKVTEELLKNEKDIEQLEKIRGVYDIEQKK